MHLNITALAIRRVFVVGITCLMPSVPCAAQFRMAWDASAAASQIDARTLVAQSNTATSIPATTTNSKWLGLSVLGTSLRFDRSYGQVRADGLVRGGGIATQASGSFNTLLATPSWNGFRLSGSFDAKRAPYFDDRSDSRDSSLSSSLADRLPTKPVPNWQATTSARLSYAHDRNGWWIGADTRRGAALGDSVLATRFVAGYSRQIRNVVVGVTLGSQAARHGVIRYTFRDTSYYQYHFDSLRKKIDSTLKIDSARSSTLASSLQRWSEVAASASWARGHFALDASLNARPRILGLASAVWGDVSGSAALSSRFALIAAMRTTPVSPGLALPSSRLFSLGMRVAPPALWRPESPTPTRSVASAFAVQQTAPDEYVVTVRLPSARSVELAGDFTGWKAVAFRQIDNTRWEVAVHTTAGSHRCNIRVDGAEWVAPPHVTSIDDEFNGRVGLIIIE